MSNLKITKLEVRKRTYKSTRNERELNAKTRVYVFHDGESVLEGFGNRTARPNKVYRKEVMPDVLDALLLETEGGWVNPNHKFDWSKWAGCSMCPCSPGFVMQAHWGYEVFVHIANADKCTDPAAAQARLEQLVGTEQAEEILA